VDPQDNVTLGKVLRAVPAGAPEQASLRGACGRAYYAAFITARDLLEAASFQIDIPYHSEHSRTTTLLQDSIDKSVCEAGSKLKSLRKVRNRADYDVGGHTKEEFGQMAVQMSLAHASDIIATLKKSAQSDGRLGIPSSVM